MEQINIQETTARIIRMEQLFDRLRQAAREDPAAIGEDRVLSAQLACLVAYYESGQWLRDYTLDEQGLLPRDLKRGVLSQDGVYDLLRLLK